MDYFWPVDLPPQTMKWGIAKAGVSFRSPYAGSVESVLFPGWFWRISITLKPRRAKDGGNAEAFFEGLAGGEDVVLVPHWLRPVPRGTLRGLPVVAVPAVRGDRQLRISGNGTLLAGDLFGIDGVVYKAMFDCTPAAGTLTVSLVGRVRKPHAVNAVVVWDRPTVRCRVPSMVHETAYQPGSMSGTAIDMEETF